MLGETTDRLDDSSGSEDNMSMYNELHSSLEQKVKTSQRLVDKLSHRAQSVEHSLQHTRQPGRFPTNNRQQQQQQQPQQQ